MADKVSKGSLNSSYASFKISKAELFGRVLPFCQFSAIRRGLKRRFPGTKKYCRLVGSVSYQPIKIGCEFTRGSKPRHLLRRDNPHNGWARILLGPSRPPSDEIQSQHEMDSTKFTDSAEPEPTWTKTCYPRTEVSKFPRPDGAPVAPLPSPPTFQATEIYNSKNPQLGGRSSQWAERLTPPADYALKEPQHTLVLHWLPERNPVRPSLDMQWER